MNLLLSIHPEYAAMIYARKKKIELRTNLPRKYNLCFDYIFLYETAPIYAVTGWIKVGNYINVNKIFSGDRQDLKTIVVKDVCMTMEQIKAYKPNLQLWGWHIKEAYNWGRNEYITRFSPSEKPPQSWCYTNADIQSSICTRFDHQLNKKSYEREREIFWKWKSFLLKKNISNGG